MDDTHTAAEEDEGEEGHIPHTQPPPFTHTLSHDPVADQARQPALVNKREPGPELTGIALQRICSSVSLQNGSAENLTTPNGANVITGSHSAFKRTSEPQRTIITAVPKDLHEKRARSPPDDMTVPLKKIKLEEPWMWLTEQADTRLDSDEDEVCEDPLSTLAAVVCLSVTERKGLEEKLFSSRSSILRSIKTEPPDLHFVKREPEDFKSDPCQKSTPVCLHTPIKSEPPPNVLLPSVQSLAEKRNLSFDQAIAIEALTQLAAIPQSTPGPVKAENKWEPPVPAAAPLSTSNTNTGRPTAAIHFNKVSVISSPLHQTSVIRPPVARQGNVIQCSSGSSSNSKPCAPGMDKAAYRRPEQGFASCIIKSEYSYRDPSDGRFSSEHDAAAGRVRRNRVEEEVAAQLADLAFIIESRDNQRPDSKPLKGAPVSAIKYISQQPPVQKKTPLKKAKATPSKPRKKKSDEGLNGRTPLSKRLSNGETPHKSRGKKVLPLGKSGRHQKRSLFLPVAQIDVKRYVVEAEEQRQLFHHSNAHTTAPLDLRSQSYGAPLHPQPSWPLSNGALHQHGPCNGHAPGPGPEGEKHLLSQVAQPCGGLQHGAGPNGGPANATFHSHATGHHGLANGFSGARQSPPPSQQGYYKLERSGPVTVLSTAADLDPGHSAESTPSKNSIHSFLESPMSFLDTPTKNLLNTPSKKQSDLPACQCMGELMLHSFMSFIHSHTRSQGQFRVSSTSKHACFWTVLRENPFTKG